MASETEVETTNNTTGKKRTLDETQPEKEESSNGEEHAAKKRLTDEDTTSAAEKSSTDSETSKPAEEVPKKEESKPLFSFNFASSSTSPTTPSVFGGFSTPLFSFSKPVGENGDQPKPFFDFKFPTPTTNDKEQFSWASFASSGTSAFGSSSTKETTAEKVVATPVQTTTGEENERRVHSVKGKLYLWSNSEKRWKERGEGKLHINVLKDNEKESRLVMRMEAAFRLILNAKVFPQMRCEKASEKTVSITAVGGVEDPEYVDKLNTFMVKLSRKDEADELVEQLQKYVKLSEEVKPKESTEKPRETKAEEKAEKPPVEEVTKDDTTKE